MNEDSVAIRLKGYIDHKGLSSSQFSDQCGIPRPTLSQLLSGRNKKISDVLVGQIHNAFPDLSILWLLFGEGEMLIESNDFSSIDSKEGEKASMCDYNDMSSPSLPNILMADSESNINRLKNSKESDLEKLLIEKEKKIEDLSVEVDRLRKRPRRVAQITVYYDDSTFETFYPGGTNYKVRGEGQKL